MKKISTLAALIALALLPGCEKNLTSNLDSNSPGGRIMYPISAAQANATIYRAMAASVPGANVTPVTEPNEGYVALFKFPRETRIYTYTATAVPAVGLRPDGTRANGYAFDISGSRTGPVRYLFESINLGAATISAPLPLASN